MKVLSVSLVLVALHLGMASTATAVTAKEARDIAKEAYIFNYPLVMYYRTMYLQASDTKSKSYSGGFGKWLHLGTSSPKDTDIVTPNNGKRSVKRVSEPAGSGEGLAGGLGRGGAGAGPRDARVRWPSGAR